MNPEQDEVDKVNEYGHFWQCLFKHSPHFFPFAERPLQVVRHMDDVETKESSSVTLSCQFAPSPRVVRWFKGRTALKTSNKYSMKREGNRAELTIHGLTGIDSGQYRCMAGGSQSTAHVKVEGRLTWFGESGL